MRKDHKGNQLLPRMYFKSGRYYYVRSNKWHSLAKNYPDALKQYATLESPRSGWSDLVRLTYQGYEQRYLDGKLSKNTWEQYQGIKPRIVYGLALFEPHEITTSVLTQFLDQYEDTPNYANRMLTILKAIFYKGCRSGACDFNPAMGVKRFTEEKRKRYLTDDEYRKIRSHANPQTRLIMDMCYLTAQRIDDVLKIQHSDISAEGIAIRQKKTDKPLLITMTPEIESVIREAKGLHKVMCKWLFHPRGKTSRYSYKAIYDSYQRAVKGAKVPDTTPHDIRAKSLTDASREGLNAQKLAGHTNPAMTERYIRLRETDVVTGPGIRKLLDC